MPIRDQAHQPVQNISLDQDLTPDLAEKAQTRFVCGAELRRDSQGRWFVVETESIGAVDCDSGNRKRVDVRLRDTENYVEARDGSRANAIVYIPPFCVRGISINDTQANGRLVYFDRRFFTHAEERMFAGLDRPEGVTMLYLEECEADAINLKG